MPPNNRGRPAWLGWAFFVVLVAGGRLAPPLANWLSQTTGLSITPPMLFAGAIGLYAVYSVVNMAWRGIRGPNQPTDSRSPTPRVSGSSPSTPPQPRPVTPPRSVALPSERALKPPSPSSQSLPEPPRFEPIIHPRILLFGIIGLFVVGGIFFGALLLSGTLP